MIIIILRNRERPYLKNKTHRNCFASFLSATVSEGRRYKSRTLKGEATKRPHHCLPLCRYDETLPSSLGVNLQKYMKHI